VKLTINYIDMLLNIPTEEGIKTIEAMTEEAKVELIRRFDLHKSYLLKRNYPELSKKVEAQKKETIKYLDTLLEMSPLRLLDKSLLEDLKGEFNLIYEEINVRQST